MISVIFPETKGFRNYYRVTRDECSSLLGGFNLGEADDGGRTLLMKTHCRPFPISQLGSLFDLGTGA
jgi:hypothetical protein